MKFEVPLQPFGQSDDISLIGNPLRYTARRLDDETKHYYYRARYYEPSWGKFLQADPLGYQGGMNRYAYVGHSPTHLIDPMGTIAIAGGFSTSQGVVDTSVSQSVLSQANTNAGWSVSGLVAGDFNLSANGLAAAGSGVAVKKGLYNSDSSIDFVTVALGQSVSADINVATFSYNAGQTNSPVKTGFGFNASFHRGLGVRVSFSYSPPKKISFSFDFGAGFGSGFYIYNVGYDVKNKR